MKAKHHFWSSLAAGGALYWATGSGWAVAGAMVGGFLIDADHVFDQLWSIRRGAPYMGKRRAELAARDAGKGGLTGLITRFVRRRKLVRLPLLFHSFELLAALLVITIYLRTPFLIGLLTGYALHIALDLTRHYQEVCSPLFYLLSYRMARGFRRERLIRAKYL
jgi:hypothetical protein